jgi:hypothetical protein
MDIRSKAGRKWGIFGVTGDTYAVVGRPINLVPGLYIYNRDHRTMLISCVLSNNFVQFKANSLIIIALFSVMTALYIQMMVMIS